MIVEITMIHMDTSVFSKETISLEDMSRLKEKALDWLKENQNKDGSFGDSIFTYNTTQVLDNLAYQNDFDNEKMEALKWLEKTKCNSNDDIFRTYLAKIKEEKHFDAISDEINFEELQNPDGGFGLSRGYKSDVMDTVLAIHCMLESDKYHNKEIRKSMNYLLLCQKEDGGFSYSGDVSNIYLTAYTYKNVKSFLNESANSAAKMMAEKCEEYLLTCAQENSLWGLEEDTIRNSLMSSITLVSDNEDTLNRIAIISDKLSENGSLYEDAELTSLYISLINEYEIVTGNINLNHVRIKEVKVSADKERIGAYTEVTFIPNVLGMRENHKVIAVVSGVGGYSQTLEEEDGDKFVWNTENHLGTYEVFVAVMDKTDGSIAASKTKTVEVLESFDVKAVTCNVSPKAYKIDSGKNIKIETSALVLSNVSKEVTAEVSIKNEAGENLYSDSNKNIGGSGCKEVIFDEFTYKPELAETTLLNVTTQIKVEGKVLQSKTSYIKVYTSEDENRIDVDYNVSSNYIYSTTDKLDVDFKLSGKGLSENVKRRPMDIAIILDNSGSMNRQDWLKAIEGAKIIIDYMQPQDRAEIRYINYDKVQVAFSGDKEYLKNQLDKRKNQFLWSGTPVYKSLNLSVKDFTEEDRDRAVYIFTDGVRDGDVSTLNEQDLIDNDIKVYSVFMECNASDSAVEKATEIMNHIADFTGGVALNVPTNDEIAECVTELLGDIFKMAGKDVELVMTIENDVPYENIDFSIIPDEVVSNDDGTTTISYIRNYLSVGEDLEFNIKYILSNLTLEEKIKMIKNIKLTYTNDNGEIIEISLDDIAVDVVGNISNVVPDEAAHEENTDDDKNAVIEVSDSNMLSHNKTEIAENENKELVSGSVALSDNSLFVGDELKADVNLNNIGNNDKNQINTRIVLIDTNNENNICCTDEVIDFPNGNEAKKIIDIQTDNLYEGNYIAILMAEVNGEMTPLDATGVALNEYRYTFTVTAKEGGNVSDKNGEYKSGELITVTATANEGYVFDRWISDDINLKMTRLTVLK